LWLRCASPKSAFGGLHKHRSRYTQLGNYENCGMRLRAEKSPNSFISKIWHTKWCPGWKAYQRDLAKQRGIENP